MLAWVWKTFILRNFSFSDYCREQNDDNFNAWCNIEKDSMSGKFCVVSCICTRKLNEHGKGHLLGSHRIFSRRLLFGSCPLRVQVSSNFYFGFIPLEFNPSVQLFYKTRKHYPHAVSSPHGLPACQQQLPGVCRFWWRNAGYPLFQTSRSP